MLVELIEAGDVEGTVACLRAMSPSERKARRSEVTQLQAKWERIGHTSMDNMNALGAAVFLCGTTRDMRNTFLGRELLVKLAREFRPPALDGLDSALLDAGWIAHMQSLVVAGIFPRPDADAYVVGLIAMCGARFVEELDLDPGLLEVVPRLFEVEGTSEHSLAAVDKYCLPAESWTHTLLGLCERGFISRAVLLDHTLRALERDFPQFRAGWFSRFHGTLSPQPDEMRPHRARYLALCHSRIPPTVALALETVDRLDSETPFETTPLLEALGPILSTGAKGLVEAALKLLDRVVRRDPVSARGAAAIAVEALVYEAPALQAKVLKRLATWGMDDVIRARTRALASSISALNRSGWEALVGASPTVSSAGAASAEVSETSTTGVGVLDESRRLVPISSVAELVTQIAFVFENGTELDELERVIEALVRMSPFPADEHPRFLPLIKRAAKLRKPVPVELARLMLAALGRPVARATTLIDFPGLSAEAHRLLGDRIDDLAELAQRGLGLPPPSSPTHRRGFLDPRAHAEREAAWRTLGVALPPDERARAERRLAGPAPTPAHHDWRLEQGAKTDQLGQTYQYVFMYVTVVDGPPDASDRRWSRGGPDDALIGYAATLQPRDLEPILGDGARVIGNNAFWCEAQWQNRAYLRLLLDPTVPFTPMATLMLAFALASKEPGESALAVDVLVRAHAERRLDIAALGEHLRTLRQAGWPPSTRYAKSLGAAARFDGRSADLVVDLLATALLASPDTPPRDTGVLLELLVELMTERRRTLTPATRGALLELRLGARGKSLQKRLAALT